MHDLRRYPSGAMLNIINTEGRGFADGVTPENSDPVDGTSHPLSGNPREQYWLWEGQTHCTLWITAALGMLGSASSRHFIKKVLSHCTWVLFLEQYMGSIQLLLYDRLAALLFMINFISCSSGWTDTARTSFSSIFLVTRMTSPTQMIGHLERRPW